MRQIEITVRLTESLQDAFEKLEKQGFKIIKEGDIDDIYLSNKVNELNLSNIQAILRKSVLLRKNTIGNSVIKKITYKNKEFDNFGNTVSEKKINIDCDDLDNAKQLFYFLDFTELVRVKYHTTVYARDGIEFAFQEVENLGTLIEYENINDFEKKSIDEINEAKKIMKKEIEKTGILLTDEIDVKKAVELIENNIKNKS